MPVLKNICYNKYFPLKVWLTTILVGTTLHILTSVPGHLHATNNPYLVELLLGINYSLFTLIISYIVFLLLIRTTISFKLIKLIVALTGCICCTATIMHKFHFGFNEIGNSEYLNLIASYCLPLATSCMLLRIKNVSSLEEEGFEEDLYD